MFDYTTFLWMLGTAIYTLIAVCSFRTLQNMDVREHGKPQSLTTNFVCAALWPFASILIGSIFLIFDAAPMGFKQGKQKE